MLKTIRALVARAGVPFAGALIASPFLLSTAAAQGSMAGAGEFVGLALRNFTPYHSMAGGLLLGVATAMSMVIKGDILGISGIVGGVVKGKHGEANRWLFIAGLVTGGTALKTVYPAALGATDAPMWRSAVAGLLVGAGVTWGNGCTSGHGICGNARLSSRSMGYTLIFMGSGFVSASLMQSGSSITFASAPIPSTQDLTTLAFQILGLHLLAYLAVTGMATAKMIQPNAARSLVTFMDGSLFALGLGVSGMTSPLKVAQFLDVSSGSWDPSLMFVMGSALLLNLPLMQGIIMSGALQKPMLSRTFSYPPPRAMDTKLIVGGVLFGAGWGLGGACPGPAIVSLLSPSPVMLVWNVTFLLGICGANASGW